MSWNAIFVYGLRQCIADDGAEGTERGSLAALLAEGQGDRCRLGDCLYAEVATVFEQS
jgi:hypothetical protein